jgi:predicted PurR-regulated permease PerM
MVLLLVLTAWGTYKPIKTAVFNVSEQWPAYWERFQKPLIKMEHHSVLSEERLQAEVRTEIRQDASEATQPQSPLDTTEAAMPDPVNETGSLRSSLMQALQGVAGSFAAMAFNAAQILVVLVTVFFGVTFVLMNPRPIFGALFLIVPERHHDRALTIAQRVADFVPRWAGATLLGMLTIGLLVLLLMWPIFGFFDALVLALIAGILEAIPYVGPLLSAVPALLLALGEGGTAPLWVVLAYIMIQVLENNVIYPIIMSRGVEVHPVALIFSTLLCVAAFGVLGVLVAAPLVAVLRILHEELYRKRFLPTTTDASLDRLARISLHEKVSDDL